MEESLQKLQHQCQTQEEKILELQQQLRSKEEEVEKLKLELSQQVAQQTQDLSNFQTHMTDGLSFQAENEIESKRLRLDEHFSRHCVETHSQQWDRNGLNQNAVHISNAAQVVFADTFYQQCKPVPPSHAADILWKQHLMQLVKQIAGKIDVPVELQQAIEAVALQLSKEVKKSPTIIEESGHYTRRNDWKQMYSTPEGNIKVKNIFEFAYSNATKDAEKYCKNEEAKSKFVRQHGNNVLVIGQAGIGKTTLTKIVAQLTLEKTILPETEYIMYVRLRDIDFNKDTDLMHFIATTGALDVKEPSVQEMVSLLKDNPNVLLIFDGIDEVKLEQPEQEGCSCSYDDLVKPSIILKNLMAGRLLPFAKKVWTCRSRQAYELHEEQRPRTILQILGLDRAAQEDLGKQICCANWLQVKRHLLTHPDIFAACYVPAICIITMASISLSFRESEPEVPALKTITQVLVFALASYSRSKHVRVKACDLHHLARLAWNGFANGKVVFTEIDYEDANISRETFEAFLVTYVDETANLNLKLLDGDKASSFSHLIWQELFAALHAMFFMPLEEFKATLQKLSSSQWEVVSKFLYGLCNKAIKLKVHKLVFGSHPNVQVWNTKRQLLKNYALEETAALRVEEPQDQTMKLLLLSSWIREADDLEFTSDIIGQIPATLNLSGTFFPTDAASIAYLIDSCLKEWEINVNNIQFVGECVDILFSSVKRRSCQTPMLYLGFNQMSNNDVERISCCLNRTEKLWLVNCGLTHPAIQALANGVRLLERQLQFLYLNNNPIGDQGASALCECLDKVVVLNLNNCSISSGGVADIAEAIRKLAQPMHILSLRNNDVGDNGAASLATCLSKLDVLDVNNSKITGGGAVNLKEAIDKLSAPKSLLARKPPDLFSEEFLVKRMMELINLGNNAIGDQGAFAFSKCLDKIGELWLKDCGVTEIGVKQMTKMHSQMADRKPRIYLGQIPGMGVSYVDLL